MTTFILIRHAATDLIGKTIAGRMPDVHLSATGRAQAERLAERLANAPIRAIYSSPLERARETVAPLAARLGLETKTSDAIGEVEFGDWTGRELRELADLAEWQRFNSFRSGTRAPNGELMLEVQARVVSELERLREWHPTEVVALVSHGDVIKALIAHYAGIPLDLFHRVEISPASVSVIALHDWGPQILRVNDTGELFEGSRIKDEG